MQDPVQNLGIRVLAPPLISYEIISELSDHSVVQFQYL